MEIPVKVEYPSESALLEAFDALGFEWLKDSVAKP